MQHAEDVVLPQLAAFRSIADANAWYARMIAEWRAQLVRSLQGATREERRAIYTRARTSMGDDPRMHAFVDTIVDEVSESGPVDAPQ